MAFNEKFKKGILGSILLVFIISLFDIIAAHSNVFGSYNQYTLGDFNGINWWPLFFQFNLLLIVIFSLFYYFLVRKDKSEAVALFLNTYTLWNFGLADILYFLLQGQFVPKELPWLNSSIYIGTVAHVLNSQIVTSAILLASVIVGFIVIFIFDKVLEGIN